MFQLRCCPLTPMTEEEMKRQCAVVSAAAEAMEPYTTEELERHAVVVQFDPPAAAVRPGLTRDQFSTRENGSIIAGLQWRIRAALGVEAHECYQYASLDEVLDTVVEYQMIPGMLEIRVVTHDGRYIHLRTLFQWTNPKEPEG